MDAAVNPVDARDDRLGAAKAEWTRMRSNWTRRAGWVRGAGAVSDRSVSAWGLDRPRLFRVFRVYVPPTGAPQNNVDILIDVDLFIC